MSLFTMPDGSSGDTSSVGGDYSLSSLDGLSGGSVGNGYGFSLAQTPDASSATSQTLGGLQSGGSNVDTTQLLLGGLGALVAADSISHGLTAQGQVPVYRAPSGAVYAIGTGPQQSQSMGILLLLGVLAFFLMEKG